MEHSKGQEYIFTFFRSGIFQDADPEMIDPETGVILDSNQFVIKDKVSQVVQKMSGDETFTSVGGDYVCIGLTWLNGYVVEFWRYTVEDNEKTLIFLNGEEVANHEDIPGDENHYLDMDSNSETGELFITDGKQPPVVYVVSDLWNEKSNETYKSNYDKALYEINTYSELSQPRFVRLESVHAFGGLWAGSYAYAMRYCTFGGDKTNWSQVTPYIPVPDSYSADPNPYVPGHKTYGRRASPSPTRYGIRMRIRVVNQAGYDFIELKRFTHKKDTPIEYPPQKEYLTLSVDVFGEEVDINENPYGVIEFVDTHNLEWLVLDEEELTERAPIKSAKTIRHINGRIVLGGIEYQSRVLENEDIFKEHPAYEGYSGEPPKNLLALPIKRKLELIGYNSMNNQVYNKSLRAGERYGWGVKLIDYMGNNLYTIPLKKTVDEGGTTYTIDYDNYKIPERREKIPPEEEEYSHKPVETSDVDSNQGASVSKTYEVFKQGEFEKYSDVAPFSIGGRYKPLTPTGRAGGYANNTRDYKGAQARVNSRVHSGGITHSYRPDNFSPTPVATGFSIGGVDPDKLPEWVTSFSVVRTEPAGRVVCQGIGTYSLEELSGGFGVRENYVRKRRDALWFYSSELDSAIGDKTAFFEDIKENPQNYKIQLVAPLGFNTEVYSGKNNRQIDMVSHANMDRPYDKRNPSDSEGDVGWGDGFVSFGRWRNQGEGSYFMSDDIYNSNDYIFSISQARTVSLAGKNGRSGYLEIFTGEDIYNYRNLSESDPNSDDVRRFHEPWYIVNIIREGAVVPEDNTNIYRDIGHHQKLDSLVTVATGEKDFEVKVVDERKEDFCPDYPLKGDPENGDPYENYPINDRCIYVDGKKWLCANFRETSVIDGWIDDLTNNGEFELNGVTYYGLYSVELDRPERKFTYIEWDEEIDTSKMKVSLLEEAPSSEEGEIFRLFSFTVKNYTYDVLYLGDLGDKDPKQEDYDDAWDGVHIEVYEYGHKEIGEAIENSIGGDYNNKSTDEELDPPFGDQKEGAIIFEAKEGGEEYDIVMETTEHVHIQEVTDFDTEQEATITSQTIRGDTIHRKADRILFPYTDDNDNPIVPGKDKEIRIKYDNRIPLAIFLGDTVVDNSLFIALDAVDDGIEPSYGNFRLNAPMPHFRYNIANNYSQRGGDNLRIDPIVALRYIRQWAIQFVSESTVNLPFVYRDYFPHRQYVLRPYEYEQIESDEDVAHYLERVGVSPRYDVDYPEEHIYWVYGGFHFPEGSNFDYQKQLHTKSFIRPIIIVGEVLYYPKRIHWSLPRKKPIPEVNTNKSFPPFNIYDIENERPSEITILYDSYSDKGNNLYVVTDRGVAMLLTQQRYMHDPQGDQTLMTLEGTFISQEVWLNYNIGCPKDKARAKAEGTIRGEKGVNVPILCFLTEDNVAAIQRDSIIEFGSGYLSTLQPAIDNIEDSTKLASVIHSKNNYFLLQIEDKIHIFGFTVNNWLANVPLKYNRMVYAPYINDFNYKNYKGVWIGAGDDNSYIENVNGEFDSISGDVECSVKFIVNPGIGSSFEFMDMFISASHKPDVIKLSIKGDFDENDDIAECNVEAIKEYAEGWYHIRFPRTNNGRVLIGKNLYVIVKYNNSEELYTLKYMKTGFKKVAGG